MTPEEKKELLKGVSEALDEVEFGKIILEMRGPDRDVDIVVEKRRRFPKNKGIVNSKTKWPNRKSQGAN